MRAWSVSTLVVVFHLVACALAGARLGRRLRRRRTLPTLNIHDGIHSLAAGSVSVVVPMRNEENNVSRCLRSLTVARGAVSQIIIVDDQSEDETRAIAVTFAERDPRIQIVVGQSLPVGWTGKNFALHQGASVARGDWLLFIDADVELHPDAVVSAVDFAARQRLGLLSLSPRQRCEGFWERLVQPVVFEMLEERYDLRAVNDPSARIAAANGQFILMRRSVYDAVGGHAAVKARILEDVALAALVKDGGYRLTFASTGVLVHTRMYDGLRALWAGWSKNLFLLLGARHAATGGIVWWHVSTSVMPCVTVGFSIVRVAAGSPDWILPLLTGIIALGILAELQRSAPACDGSRPWMALLAPLGRFLFVLIVVNSWYQHVIRGIVRWSGREYRHHRGTPS